MSTQDDDGSSVTLVLYKVGSDWYRGGEPLLNLIAAAAQGSLFTHVELSIGETAGKGGRMTNVLRIFNDSAGVELAERTGINPSYEYLQLGCSKRAEAAMLRFAKSQIGKPFSQSGMARSIVWPRKSDGKSWFCAELVAACLQVGGLLSPTSCSGAATPASLYKMYKASGTVSANPCTLRREFGGTHSSQDAERLNLLGLKRNAGAPLTQPRDTSFTFASNVRASSGIKFQGSFRQMPRSDPSPAEASKFLPETFTLHSLEMRARR